MPIVEIAEQGTLPARKPIMAPAGEWAHLFIDGVDLNDLERRVSLALVNKGRGDNITILSMPSTGKNGMYYYVESRGRVTIKTIVAIAKAYVEKNLGEVNELITHL